MTLRGADRVRRGWVWLAACLTVSTVIAHGSTVSYQRTEIQVTGDFDGDGWPDVAVLEHSAASLTGINGAYRVGYQRQPGAFEWVAARRSRIHRPTGVAVGRFLAADRDSLALTEPDADFIQLLDLSPNSEPPVSIQVISEGRGPLSIAAIPVPGGTGKSPEELAVFTVFGPEMTNGLESLVTPDGMPGRLRRQRLPVPDLTGSGSQWMRLHTMELERGRRGVVGGVLSGSYQWGWQRPSNTVLESRGSIHAA